MSYLKLWFTLAALCCFIWTASPKATAIVVDGNIIMDQRMSENLCALTFDDGPSRYTPQLLDMLTDYGIPATFFLLGKQAELHPNLVRRIVAEGHEVGNHSYSHPNLRLIPPARKAEEIQRTDAILRELGASPLYLRPPYGTYDRFTVDIADALGLSVMLWSVDSRDWQRLPADYAQLRTSRGFSYPQGALRGIFLFHDTYKATVDALPKIIEDLRAGGCSRFVTVSEYLSDMQDPEPGLMMTRRAAPAIPTASMPMAPEQMPLASRSNTGAPQTGANQDIASLTGQSHDGQKRIAQTMPAAGLVPTSMPLARCSTPWQPEAEAIANTNGPRPALSRSKSPTRTTTSPASQAISGAVTTAPLS